MSLTKLSYAMIQGAPVNVLDFGAKGDGVTDDTTAIKAAISAVGAAGGGVVYFPTGRYVIKGLTYNTNYISTAGVTLRGEAMPSLSSNADRLEKGAVICGRFNVFADDFSIENIGFDLGKYEMDTNYPGYDSHSANLLGGTWDAFAFAQPNSGSPLPARRNFSARNVIGLCRDSSSVAHAMLMEGFDGGFIDNVIGMYGIHGVVIKSQNVICGSIRGYSAGSDCLIIKSDTYAAAGNIMIDQIDVKRYPPSSITPWSTPAQTTYGVLINPATASFTGPIQIGSIKCFGQTNGVRLDGSYSANDVQINSILADGYTGTMDYSFAAVTGTYVRFQIGNIIANTCLQGIYWKTLSATTDSQLQIGNFMATNITNGAIYAINYGSIRLDIFEAKNCGGAYYINNDALVLVGTERLSSVTTKWMLNAPSLNAQWSNFGSNNSTFDVIMSGYKIQLKGLVKASATPSATIISLPQYLRPLENLRWSAYFNNGSRSTALVGYDTTSATILLNDGTAPAATNYVSLDGISWPL